MEENIENIKDIILKFGMRAVDEYRQENIPALTGERTNNYLSLIAGFMGMLHERKAELRILEVEFMITNREKYKSNVDTKLYWEGSELGKEQIRVLELMDSAKEIMRACRDRLRQLQQEAFNQQ